MGILASGILAPTALAASPTLTDIYSRLVGLDTKVTAIQEKTDKLPSDPTSQEQTGSVKSVRVSKVVDPSFGTEQIELISTVAGKTFSGHLMTNYFGSLGNDADVVCIVQDSVIFLASGTSPSSVDFACDGLYIRVSDRFDDYGPLDVRAVAQYVESSNIINIS